MPTVDVQKDKVSIRYEHQSVNGYLKRDVFVDPLALLATKLKTGQATTSSAITTVTSFSAQPDIARKISITPGGTTADVKAGNYVVTGTNIRNEVISSTLVFADNDTAAQISDKAFKTVTSVVLPIQDGNGATFDIGITDALGLSRCMSEAAVIDAYIDGVRETTAATVTFHATDISKNTVDPNTALNGTKDLTVAYIATEPRNP